MKDKEGNFILASVKMGYKMEMPEKYIHLYADVWKRPETKEYTTINSQYNQTSEA